MTQFVFCHGFGFNTHFWGNLAPYFRPENCSFIDLGYFKKPSSSLKIHDQKVIGIGHSLGLLKLKEFYENFECLIGLNSFINFLGSNQNIRKRRQLELKALEKSFKCNPISTLKKFYERCGVSDFMDLSEMADLDLNLLLDDIEFLATSWDIPSIPMLNLYSYNDVIVPKEVVSDNFVHHPNIKIDIITDAQHGIGFIKPLEVYEKIMSFLDGSIT